MAQKSRFTFNVWGFRGFRLLLFTRMFSSMAGQAQAVVVGWQVYTLTKDPLLLGLIGLAEAVPALSCALIAGHIVDTSQPRRVYTWALGVMLLNTILLLAAGGGYLDLSKTALLAVLFTGIFISGIARSFISPASFSMLTQVVPRVELPAAAAWMSTSFQTSSIAAPAIAGLIYGGYGPHGAWLMPAGLLTVAFLMLLEIPRLEPFERQKRLPAVQSIKEGWQFITSTPILLAAMSLDMLAVLFGGAVALLPAFAAEIIFSGAEELGVLRAAPAIGAVAIAVIMASRPMKKIPGVALLWVVGGFGICMIGFGLSKTFFWAVFFLTLSGMFDSVSMVIRSTLMQILTPDSMRGRVSSVNSMFITSSNELGAFESGVLAKLIGIAPAIVAGGFGTLFVTGLTAWKAPGLRKTVVETPEDPVK